MPRGAGRKIAERLVQHGFWTVVPDGWQISNWTTFAWSAEQVAAHRATQAEKASAGGLARAASAQRDAGGRWAGAAHQPEDQPAGLDDRQPDSSPDTDADTDADAVVEEVVPPPLRTDSGIATDHVVSSTTDSTDGLPLDEDDEEVTESGAAGRPTPPVSPPVSARVSGGHGRERQPDIRVGRRAKRYDPAWREASEPFHGGWRLPEKAAFRRVWEWRGFERPPSEKQWALVDEVNRVEPETLARLVEEAPTGLQSNEVIGWVLHRLNADPRRRGLVAVGRKRYGQRATEASAGAHAAEPVGAADESADDPDVIGEFTEERLQGASPDEALDTADWIDDTDFDVKTGREDGVVLVGNLPDAPMHHARRDVHAEACADQRGHQKGHRYSLEAERFVCDICTARRGRSS